MAVGCYSVFTVDFLRDLSDNFHSNHKNIKSNLRIRRKKEWGGGGRWGEVEGGKEGEWEDGEEKEGRREGRQVGETYQWIVIILDIICCLILYFYFLNPINCIPLSLSLKEDAIYFHPSWLS